MNEIILVPPSRREANKRAANKIEKLKRIRQAAKRVFLAKGFDSATIREIAVQADVALGTLFLYAKDKQDLLLLIFEEDFPVVRQAAFESARPEMPFLDQLIAFFSVIYEHFFLTPALSKDMLREVAFSTGIVAQRIGKDMAEYERCLARLVARAQAEGQISPSVRADIAAHTFFNLHRIEIRICINAPDLNVEESLKNLRQQFELLFNGLKLRD